MSESIRAKLTRLRNDLEWNERIISSESAVLAEAQTTLAAQAAEIERLREVLRQASQYVPTADVKLQKSIYDLQGDD